MQVVAVQSIDSHELVIQFTEGGLVTIDDL